MEDITEVTSEMFDEIILSESDGTKKVIDTDNVEKTVIVPKGKQLEGDKMEEKVEELEEKLSEKEEKLEEFKKQRREELAETVADIRDEKGILSKDKEKVVENLKKLSIDQLNVLKEDAKAVEVDNDNLSVSKPNDEPEEQENEQLSKEEKLEQMSKDEKKNKVREFLYGKDSDLIGD